MLCKCSGKYIDIYFILKITYFIFGSDASVIPSLLMPKGKLATDPREKAEILHSTFEDVLLFALEKLKFLATLIVGVV